jgi:hypothetical protein
MEDTIELFRSPRPIFIGIFNGEIGSKHASLWAKNLYELNSFFDD